LFTIDPRPCQAQLAAAQGTVAQSKAMLDFARIQVDRAAGLIQTKAISQLEYDQRKNAFAVARAQIQQGEAAVETARLNLQYCQIHSPIDGRAGRRLVDPGNVVKENETTLLTVQRLDPIYADFTVTENDLTAVQRNMRSGALKAEVRLPDEPDKPVAGALTFLDNSVQAQTGAVGLRATFANPDHPHCPARRGRRRSEVMNLSEPFIRRPVMTAVLTAAVIVFGVIAYRRLPVNDLPTVDYPVINVFAGYPGASPETVANNIATPLERQ